MCAVEEDVVLLGSATASLLNFLNHASSDDVSRCEVLNGRRVTLHKPLTRGVAKDCSFSTRTLGQRNAQPGKTCWVELEELHVLERNSFAPDDAHAISGQRVSIRGGFVNLSETTGRKDNRFCVEDVDVASSKFVGHHAGCLLRLGLALALFARWVVDHDQVQHVELVVKLDPHLHAVLEEGLQDHVSGTVCCVAGATNGRFAMVAGVAAEATLVDFPVGRAVER